MIKLKSFILNSFSILFLLSSVSFCPPKREGQEAKNSAVVRYAPKTLQPKVLIQPKRQFFTNDPTFVVLISNQRALLTVFGNNVIIALQGRTIILEDLLSRPQTEGFFFVNGAMMLLDNCEISITTSKSVPGALKVTGNIIPFLDPEAFLNATKPSMTKSATRLILNQGTYTQEDATIRKEFLFPIPNSARLLFSNFPDTSVLYS